MQTSICRPFCFDDERLFKKVWIGFVMVLYELDNVSECEWDLVCQFVFVR
jgi:hypothetical protein